jgi:2-polyprenyl-3-methyl-5-hydroxy-6-metoxy-1,4-benzoquinol methylase
MDNYWDQRFLKEKIVWGKNPSNVARNCLKYFIENDVKNILIMGIGYGRNGKYFIENGYDVDGIEYSEEAINIGKEFCPQINFINGSVLEATTGKKYDAIFCYSILHLFKEEERKLLIENCIHYCTENGIIVFSCCSIKDKTFGIGERIEENTFEIKKGKIIHFYNENEVRNIHDNLENIILEYSIEEIEAEERYETYNMIYGIYMVVKCKNVA